MTSAFRPTLGGGTVCIVPRMSESTRNNRRSTPPVLDTTDAAAYLRCTTATVRRMVRDGRLPAARVGDHLRYRLSDLNALFTTTDGGQQP